MTIVFDLDGTLIDTYPILKATLETVFAQYTPNKPYTTKDINGFFGPPLSVSFSQWTNDQALAQEMLIAYRKISEEIAEEKLKPFTHTLDVLQTLKKEHYQLAICSNKIHRVAEKHLRMCGILEYFDVIIGGDDVVYHKPHSEGINKIKKTCSDVIMMIGDSLIDIDTAKNAEIIAVGIANNEILKQQMLKAGADYIIKDIKEVLKIVKEL